MLSVEQLQRTNTLSKELKTFGFAQNSEQAYNMAEKVFDNPGVRSGGEAKPDAQTEVLRKVSDLERVRVQMNKKLSDFGEQLSSVTQKLDELSKALKLVEMNQISFDKKLSGIHPEKRMELPKELSRMEVVAPEASQKPLDKPIDRNGVAPADVQIDKFFYAGKR